MGFFGGGGNIAIATALPPSFCVLYCKHLIVYGIHITDFFYACLRLRFPDRDWIVYELSSARPTNQDTGVEVRPPNSNNFLS